MMRNAGSRFKFRSRGRTFLVGVSLCFFLGWLAFPETVRACRTAAVAYLNLGSEPQVNALSALLAVDEPFAWSTDAGLIGMPGPDSAWRTASAAKSLPTPMSVALSVSLLIGGLIVVDRIRTAALAPSVDVWARFRVSLRQATARVRIWREAAGELVPIDRLAPVRVSVAFLLALGFFVGWLTAPDFVRRQEPSVAGFLKVSPAEPTRLLNQFASWLSEEGTPLIAVAASSNETDSGGFIDSIRQPLDLDVFYQEPDEGEQFGSTEIQTASLGVHPGNAPADALRDHAASPRGEDSPSLRSDPGWSEEARYALLTYASFGNSSGGEPGGGSDGSQFSEPGDGNAGESDPPVEGESPFDPSSDEDRPKETACASTDPSCLLRSQVSALLTVPDQALVRFATGATDEEIAAALAPSSGRIVECYSVNGYCLVEMPQNPDLASAILELRENPTVSSAEPNYVREIAGNASDSFYPVQWSLAKINADGAWSAMGVNTRVKVAVLDTGFDVQHPDLEGVVVVKDSYNAVDRGFDVTGNPEHGTMVAGILAALGNDYGIAGANPNWADLALIKVFGNGSTTNDATIISGIQNLPTGTKVVNLSLAGEGFPADPLCAAIRSKTDDVLFVIAAGNSGTTGKLYPAACESPNIIAVASSDVQDQLAISSSRGPWVHLAAPGEGIFTDAPNSLFTLGSGSSMAAPHVAAVASMIFAKEGASVASVKSKILESVDQPLLGLNVQTGGRLNACRALGACK